MTSLHRAIVLWGWWIWAETAQNLAEKWHEVIVVVKTRITHILAEALRCHPGKIKIICADLRQKSEVERILYMYGHGALVYAFAANAFGASHTGSSTEGPMQDFENNAIINQNVIDCATRMHETWNGVTSISFSSSYFTYLALQHLGMSDTQKTFSEEDLDPMQFSEWDLQKLKNIQPYLWEKILSERRYIELSQKWIRVHRFRFGNVYGAGQRHVIKHPHMFPNLFALREEFQMFGNGEQERAWIYVRDVVDGVLACSLREGHESTLYNLGGTADSAHHKLCDVLPLAIQALWIQGIKRNNPDAPGGQSLWLSSDRAQKELGWKPQHSLESGIQKTMDFYRQFWLGK